MEFVTQTEVDLAPVAKHLIQLSKQQKVFTFSGDLGAGKTTLIKQFCKHFGVIDTVSSPTFGLVNVYRANNEEEIYHFDCYRLKDITEVYDIGFEEYIDSGNICLIEWPDIVEPLLPPNYISIKISHQQKGERLFEIENV
jgi:tRNA threonylcarbamoyladenosine biosynthesis protein TsaE